MSLDVSLIVKEPIRRDGTGIFIRRDGATVEISRAEWDRLNPGCDPVVFLGEGETTEAYSANITHNLGNMATEAGIYQHLWRPEELGITQAHELVAPLAQGLMLLKLDPERFEAFNAPNGWGLYEHFVPFVEQYLAACIAYPRATVEVSR
jgi:hypothetical protein